MASERRRGEMYFQTTLGYWSSYFSNPSTTRGGVFDRISVDRLSETDKKFWILFVAGQFELKTSYKCKSRSTTT